MEDTKDVVDAAHECDFLAQDIHARPRHDARAQANGDGRPTGDETRAGSDGDEACDHAVDGADGGGFAVVEIVAHGPAEHTHRRTNIRVQNRDASVCRGGIGITTVEAVPTEPEDACANEDVADITRAVVLPVCVEARADPPCGHEACGSGRDVDDVTAGVVEGAEDGEVAAAPDGVGDDAVGEGEPEGDVDDPSEEVHAAEERAGCQDEGDGCEDELEVYHCAHWEGRRDTAGGEYGLRKFVLHR